MDDRIADDAELDVVDHDDVEVVTNQSESPSSAANLTPEPKADSPTTPPIQIMNESHRISNRATEFNSQVDQETITNAIAEVERAKTPLMTSFRQLAMQTPTVTTPVKPVEKVSHDVAVQDSPPGEAVTPEMITMEFGCQTEPNQNQQSNLSPDSVTQCSIADDNASIQFAMSPMDAGTPLQRHMSRDEL